MNAAAALLLLSLALAQRQGPRQGSLQVGVPAPDFNLKVLKSDRTFKLSSNFGERPTVLIFGSYT